MLPVREVAVLCPSAVEGLLESHLVGADPKALLGTSEILDRQDQPRWPSPDFQAELVQELAEAAVGTLPALSILLRALRAVVAVLRQAAEPVEAEVGDWTPGDGFVVKQQHPTVLVALQTPIVPYM